MSAIWQSTTSNDPLREGHRRGVPFRHSMSGRTAARDRQHGGVEVQADDPARAAEPVGDRAGDDARPARHVEHGLARPDAGEVDEVRRPLREEGGHELGLVDLRGRHRDLEGLRGALHARLLPAACRGLVMRVAPQCKIAP